MGDSGGNRFSDIRMSAQIAAAIMVDIRRGSFGFSGPMAEEMLVRFQPVAFTLE